MQFRSILQNQEKRFYWRGYSDQCEEETEEEGEEEEKARHRTCEMDELLALRARVETQERDVAGLEAVIQNLDKDFDTLESQVVRLFVDTSTNQWFVPPSGPPETW